MSVEANQPIDTLRLTEAAALTIGETLDRQSSAHDGEAPAGVPVRMLPLVMEIQQAGGAMAQYRVLPRRLGPDELALLHGFFLNVGTSCVLTMETLDHERVRVDAVVRRCRHAQGRIHEVVLSLSQRVDPAHFVKPALRTGPTAAGNGKETAAGAKGPSGAAIGGAIGDELVRAAERLVALAREGGSPDARRAIESRMRQLLGVRAA